MMATRRRFIWILKMAAILVMTSGCAGTNLTSVEDEIVRDGTGIHKERGQSVRGYLLDGDSMVEYKGMVRLTEQDSLAFWSEGYSEEMGHQGIRKKVTIPGPVFACSEIKALEVVAEEKNKRIAGLLIVLPILAISIVYLATQPLY